jgi:hypothetical protein
LDWRRAFFWFFCGVKKGPATTEKSALRLREEGRGTHEARVPVAEGDGKNPQVRRGVSGPIYAVSFTGAVKLIVNDSRRRDKIKAGDGRPIDFPRTTCSTAKKIPMNRIGPPAFSPFQLHHADVRYFSPGVRNRFLVVTS